RIQAEGRERGETAKRVARDRAEEPPRPTRRTGCMSAPHRQRPHVFHWRQQRPYRLFPRNHVRSSPYSKLRCPFAPGLCCVLHAPPWHCASCGSSSIPPGAHWGDAACLALYAFDAQRRESSVAPDPVTDSFATTPLIGVAWGNAS